MPRTSSLPLALHQQLQAAFAEIYPTAESFLAAQDALAVPEDTPDRHFTQQAEETLLDYAKAHLAPKPVNGLALKHDATHNCRVLTTGCSSVDELLLEGVREGQLTEIAGHPSTGKTQLATGAALRGERVVFVDTGQAFSAERVIAMAKARSPQFIQTPEALTTLLSCVEIYNCHSLQDLVLICVRAEQKIRAHNAKTSLFIVDSIGALVPTALGLKNSMQGHCLMLQASILLKQLADRHKLAAVVTNHLVAGQVESFKPAMGESWRNQPHVRLVLTRQDKGSADGPERRATLAATQLVASSSRVKFLIDDTGLKGMLEGKG